jgi:asparagine synthase (glutamine-hydrolyzing)
MCGIAGFINFENSAELVQITGAVQCHRGPDAQKAWTHDNIALAHQRLSIIDLSERSDQPLVKNGLVIVFNGEIYNYEDLKKQIRSSHPDIEFVTSSDTEVLLELYRVRKEKCLDDVIGMFAFAIYEIDTGTLFMARDHFGIKPLFYTRIGNAFAFSSELKTLVRIPGFNKSINDTSLLAAINYLWLPGNDTMFSNCFKLPAAHAMTIHTREPGLNPIIHRYWKLETVIKYSDENEAIAALQTTLEASIKRHMVADVPVSSFLSGGLDSSLISVMAQKLNPQLSTYTIGTLARDKKVEQMPEDEKHARILASQFHFDHHEINITPDIIKELPRMVYMLDEPIGDPAAINTYLICKAARENGVKVLLSGMGADELFFGYRRQQATLQTIKYKKLPAAIKQLASAVIGVLPVKFMGRGIKLSRWAKRFNTFANLPLEEAYMRSYSYYDSKELSRLFKKDITACYHQLRSYHSSIFYESYRNDPQNQMCYTDIHMFMQGLNLSYTDKSSMAASVEVRVPFIDKQVVETAMQIEGSLKFKGNVSKYILKKVAKQYLPHQIVYRPKASFGAPIRSWISGDLAHMVDDLLSRERIEKRGIFNYDYVKQLIEADRKGIEDNAYRIYQLLTVELWFSSYIDNQTA